MSAHEKVCSKCGVVKSLDDFHRDKRHKSGRQSQCRACKSEQHRRYREENRERLSERERRYREENREKLAAKYRRHREENRDYLKAKSINSHMNYQHTSELFLGKPKWTPWTQEEDAFLLTNDGRTHYQKAIELGRTYSSVCNRLYRLRKAQAQ